jgi:hypothetical protein
MTNLNRRALSGTLLLLGIALLVMGFWQLNQWQTTLAQASSAKEAIQALGTLGGGLEGLGGSLTATTDALDRTTAATFNIAVIDLVLGLVLAALGLFTYPNRPE